jgi:hypothetical protein
MTLLWAWTRARARLDATILLSTRRLGQTADAADAKAPTLCSPPRFSSSPNKTNKTHTKQPVLRNFVHYLEACFGPAHKFAPNGTQVLLCAVIVAVVAHGGGGRR